LYVRSSLGGASNVDRHVVANDERRSRMDTLTKEMPTIGSSISPPTTKIGVEIKVHRYLKRCHNHKHVNNKNFCKK
jgi:hypothetical protein